MLIAHVERSGVWLVDGGMHALPRSLAALAAACGARFHYGADVREVVARSGKVVAIRLAGGEEVPTETAIVNGDVAAVAAGLFGPAAARGVPGQSPRRRSMSAVTWSLVAKTAGLPLVRHTVFYAPESRSEFQDALRQRRLPRQPSVYLCAQDRGGTDGPPVQKNERLLCVVNAPANGDQGGPDEAELQAFEVAVFGLMGRCGLQIEREPALSVRHTPVDFEALCPGTGGALYGAVSHGWSAAFRRSGARTALPGLYLAGGSVHPGAGVPMAALSGHLAAQRVISDHSRGQGAG
jgi:1-hydroxycarotenoid 3,4-desaturase